MECYCWSIAFIVATLKHIYMCVCVCVSKSWSIAFIVATLLLSHISDHITILFYFFGFSSLLIAYCKIYSLWPNVIHYMPNVIHYIHRYVHTYVCTYIYYCLTVLPLPTLCPFPLYGIRATLFWPVIVVLCSLSLHLCLPEKSASASNVFSVSITLFSMAFL